jgi:hypothetical protein
MGSDVQKLQTRPATLTITKRVNKTSLQLTVGAVALESRSLRMEYNICTTSARSSFSGAIDGRPSLAYMRSNSRDNERSTSSTIVRIFQAKERPARQIEEKQKRIEFLEKKVQTKDEVLAELMAEHIALKKSLGEL